MAAKIPDATLFINGSGYVSPTFPEIPSNYPGSSPDYYYTPLGSVTVTDGRLFRRLTGVPYYGLSLTRDGLHMHVGDDPADVLAANPTQTWSFYIECPVIRDHQSILDPNWRFTTAPAMPHHHQLHRRTQFHPADSHARQQQRPDHAPVR